MQHWEDKMLHTTHCPGLELSGKEPCIASSKVEVRPKQQQLREMYQWQRMYKVAPMLM